MEGRDMNSDVLYVSLVWATGTLAFGLVYLTYRYSRDTLHPVIFLGVPLAYTYYLVPLLLYAKGTVADYLPMNRMAEVQLIYLLGVVSLLLGALLVGRPSTRARKFWAPPPGVRKQLVRAAVGLGATGIIGYFLSVYTSGGFRSVYGVVHGNAGENLSGYVMNLKWFLVSAIVLVLLSTAGRRIHLSDLGLLMVFSVPLMIRAVLTGGRGTAFVIVTTLAVGWCITRGRRPSLLIVLCGGAALGLFLLILATHRNTLRLGTQFNFGGWGQTFSFVDRSSRGQAYIYGSGTIINTVQTGNYQWGARYVLMILVRAIPHVLWPTEHEDVRNFLGIQGNVLVNNVKALGWNATNGASTGLIAAVWQQFWWLYIVVLWFIGRLFGKVWLRSVVRGDGWVVMYVLMIAFSLYLTEQTLQAWLWRMLFVGGVTWIVWRSTIYPRLRQIRRHYKRLYTQHTVVNRVGS